VIVDPSQDRDGPVRQALKVGYERPAGELDDGMGAWRSAGLPEARIPLAEVADQAGAGELPGGPLAVICGHGERAMTGASLLQRAGRGDLTVLVGGPGDWSRATRRPLEPS
jgi:hydroxyacylglutathione hydrolase